MASYTAQALTKWLLRRQYKGKTPCTRTRCNVTAEEGEGTRFKGASQAACFTKQHLLQARAKQPCRIQPQAWTVEQRPEVHYTVHTVHAAMSCLYKSCATNDANNMRQQHAACSMTRHLCGCAIAFKACSASCAWLCCCVGWHQ